MDVTPYLANLRRMQAEADAADEARAAVARAALPALVKLLVDRLGVTRVVLFGSLLEGRLHERSDIDLAVAGLAPERYWEALWRAAEIAGRDVDLVPLEEASESLRERIETSGEVLHG
ncbi:MAG: nucleotidyltransferase domain-containing protein [Deltaproteobacteria bacterium]|nr:nucleotidyltransferase domain-containing protein [Deltaproteobacteria bacterium]